MVYTQEEFDPATGKYKKYFDLITVKWNQKNINGKLINQARIVQKIIKYLELIEDTGLSRQE